MSQYDDSGVKSYEGSAAIAKGARVKLESAGTVATAAIGEKEIGTALNAIFAAGQRVAVKLRTAPGTHKMIASAALSAGVEAFTAAAGKIGASASGAYRLGHTMGASSADGDIIEVCYGAHGDTVVP